MPDKQPPEHTATKATDPPEQGTRFPELVEIQREIELRIRDNKRFLERFMDDDFAGEEDEPDEDDEVFEEL